MKEPIDRRQFLSVVAAATATASAASQGAASEQQSGGPAASTGGPSGADVRQPSPYLTDAGAFVDVSRGRPKPYRLRGEALVKARLTPETWRLEVVGDESSRVPHPCRLEDGTALDLAALEKLGETHGIRFLKAMQCNNIPAPLGQGLWEGVPLREVIRRVGRVWNVRRVYYWGFHNNDPAQMFQSSLSYACAMENPPWEPPAIVAYRLNGQPIPLERGGPVRMVVPWAHGFKSIKWLQRIVLTNDYKANDTYALQNNDPDSYLKTAAYIGKGETTFKAGEPVEATGMAMSGWSGLKRVEYSLRRALPGADRLKDDDPAWNSVVWHRCAIMEPPADWSSILPAKVTSRDVWGFDPTTGRPRSWPLPFSMVSWSLQASGVEAGSYELRVRAVDLNGFAQPEPRPYPKAGMNQVPMQTLVVSA